MTIQTEWWHLYGSVVSIMIHPETDEMQSAWIHMLIGPVRQGPLDHRLVSDALVSDPLPLDSLGVDATIAYLGSWQGMPSLDELEVCVDEEWRSIAAPVLAAQLDSVKARRSAHLS